MKESIIDSYAKKFNKLTECCVYVQQSYDLEIKEKNHDNPIYGEFWRQGGFNGALTYFLRTLSEDEKKINSMVFDRIIHTHKSEEGVDVIDFIDAGIEVLELLGRPTYIPKDVKAKSTTEYPLQ